MNINKAILIVLLFISNLVLAQQKKEITISKSELIGTWQKDNNKIGDGLNQNFVFRKDGTFILNLINEGEDLRNLIKIGGTFRLVKNEIYFTIMYKTFIDGTIQVANPGVTFNLFQFDESSKAKEIKVLNPKEMLDPCYITVISSFNIKINNEVYFKLK